MITKTLLIMNYVNIPNLHRHHYYKVMLVTAAPLSVDISQMCSPIVLRPSQMIKLGQVIDNIKPANKQWKISLQSFDTIAMNWVQPKTYHCSFEAKSFAQGAFREVYAAKINDDLFAKKDGFQEIPTSSGGNNEHI